MALRNCNQERSDNQQEGCIEKYMLTTKVSASDGVASVEVCIVSMDSRHGISTFLYELDWKLFQQDNKILHDYYKYIDIWLLFLHLKGLCEFKYSCTCSPTSTC